jgi:uridine kinase
MTLDDLAWLLHTTGATTVLIDGRSGAGKTTLADELQGRWAGSAVVRLEDIYPGWDGLAAAVEHLHSELLTPRSAGRVARWRRWDWTADRPAEWRTVDAERLIVEGVGALSGGNAELADVRIWVEVPDGVRKERALQRDGDTFRPHWDRWARQEDALIAEFDPRDRADFVVTDGGDGRVRVDPV